MTTANLLYTIDPFDPAGHRLRVTLRIDAPEPSGQTVRLPAWIPGSYLIRDFSRNIETLQGHAQGKTVPVTQHDAHTWTFAPCEGPLEIEAIIYAWDASVRACHFDDSHCFLNGTSIFLEPQGLSDLPCIVDILPAPHRKDWRAWCSLPQTSGPAGVMARFEAPNYDALVDHPFEIGTPQVMTFMVHGVEHEFVVTGHYPNLDLERIVEDTRKICEAQVALFEPDSLEAPFLDSAQKYVFMLTITHDLYGGLEHRASTALMYPRRDLPTLGQSEAPKGYADFLGLVSHEYFHTWHVKRIKPERFAPYPLQEPAHTDLLWIFEGFTSYYDDLMLLRSGVIDEETYHRQLCKNIDHALNGTGRQKQSLAQSSFNAWTKYYKQDENAPNAIVSYYTKGAVAALALDLTIQQRSNGEFNLDDVMRALWSRYGRDFYRGKPEGLPEDGLVPLIKEVTGLDLEADIHRWVEKTGDIPLQKLLETAGYSFTRESEDERPSLDITTRTQNGQLVIRNVLEGGAGHQGGLSAHDVLVALADLAIGSDAAGRKRLLDMHAPGDVVSVHVFRDGVLRRFEVTLAPPRANKSRIKAL